MYKACSKCGKIHKASYQCRKIIPINPDKAERKMRNTYAWAKKSREIRGAALFCEVCALQGRYVYDNLSVHHIEKIKDRSDLLLDNENLICLCSSCHSKAEKGEIDKDFLKEIAQRRECRDTPHPL